MLAGLRSCTGGERNKLAGHGEPRQSVRPGAPLGGVAMGASHTRSEHKYHNLVEKTGCE